MKSILVFSFSILFFCVLLSCDKRPSKQAKSDFISIFNGKNLDGWEGDSTYWRVENGNLVGEVTPETILKRNSFIIYKKEQPENFELKLEYRISALGNSGINYRSEMIEGMRLLR